MEILSLPLSWLMRQCHALAGHYSLAIVLFTLLTKLILLPVSAWVHRNGITMVSIMPELNRIKIDHFGDGDAIADEQQALYKRANYHPLAGTVPMFVQLILLIGVITAVRTWLSGAVTIMTWVPSGYGGLTLLMPIAAGLSALALGQAQNRLNPLQREQSPASQWGTNGLSIGISLVLGMFVPLGVGVYWIASNLLTIPQQLLLNALIPPKKYVDYDALAASKQELSGMKRLGAEISREDRAREKADYKRFFSIANKHLAFYSESGGFYKYYEDIIEYLLAHANLSIHYITSDPKDPIFEKAKEEPRIKPYYIGEKRLITLMMKMDADMVVMTVPDLDNYHLKRSYVRKDVEYVYVFHYPLSTHMVLPKGALDHYDTIMCVGEFQFEEIRRAEELYGLPAKQLIACGYGQLEKLQRSYAELPQEKREIPKILIAPSWQHDNILDSCIDPLLDELLGQGFQVVVRPHPEYMKRYGARMAAIVERYKNRTGDELQFELDFTSNRSIFDSDVVITDWSGTAYEAAFVTLRPAVFVDTPPKINNPEYERLGVEPLELSLRDQVGIRVNPENMHGLAERIRGLLKERERYAEEIAAIRDRTIANLDTGSGRAAGKYILTSLQNRVTPTK